MIFKDLDGLFIGAIPDTFSLGCFHPVTPRTSVEQVDPGLTSHVAKTVFVCDIGAAGADLVDDIHGQGLVIDDNPSQRDLYHTDHLRIHDQLGVVHGKPLLQNPGAEDDVPA